MAEEAGRVRPMRHSEIMERKIDMVVNILKDTYVDFGGRRNVFLFVLRGSS